LVKKIIIFKTFLHPFKIIQNLDIKMNLFRSRNFKKLTP